jgi:hypothetical protein
MRSRTSTGAGGLAVDGLRGGADRRRCDFILRLIQH